MVAGVPSLRRRIGHRGAVIPAGSRDHARRRHLAHQQVGECAARFERSGMLQKFELEDQGAAEAEIRAVDLENRRAADVGPDQPLGRCDPFPGMLCVSTTLQYT